MPNNILERATYYTLRHDKVQAQVLPPIHKKQVGPGFSPDKDTTAVPATLSELKPGPTCSWPWGCIRECTNKQLQALKNFERLRPVLHTA
jgi:hypothetical protein